MMSDGWLIYWILPEQLVYMRPQPVQAFSTYIWVLMALVCALQSALEGVVLPSRNQKSGRKERDVGFMSKKCRIV